MVRSEMPVSQWLVFQSPFAAQSALEVIITHTNHNWDVFLFFPNYFQYLDFKNWNKKLFQVMQLQRKIYWDQLKMLLFL